MRKHRSSGIGRVQQIAGLGLTLALLGTVLPNAKAASAPGTIERVSVSATGAQRNNIPTGSTTGCSAEATNGKCTKRTVSDAGDLVVFSSKAPNLVPGDTNNMADIFLWRRTPPAGEANVISLTHGGDGPSEFATISPNGEWVAFESKATNLPATGGSPAFTDVYVYNVASKAMHLVSVPNQDGQIPNNKSVAPSVADNGAVAFGSFASNMVLPQGNATFQQVYVNRNPAAGGKAELVSVTASNAPGNGPGKEAWISAAGDKIVFTSFAPLDTNEDQVTADDDIYVRELGASPETATTKRLTSDAQAGLPSMSPNGSTVAFMAEKSLVAGDGDVRKDIYTISSSGGSPSLASDCACGGNDLMDRPAVVPSIANDGTVVFQSAARFISGVNSEQVWLGSGPTLVSGQGVGDDATAANEVAEFASVSADANFVAFTSAADNLVPSDNNSTEDVFLWERTGGTIIRVSVGPNGAEASGFQITPNSAPAMSADGKVIAFESDSSNLVDGDGNGMADIFIRDRAAGTTTRIMAEGGAQPNGSSFKPVISGDGNVVVFESVASNLVTAGDTNEAADIYMYNRSTGALTRVSNPPFGEQAGIPARNPSISPNGQWVAFESEGYFDETTPPSQGRTAIYRYNVGTGKSQLVSRSGERPDVANSRPSWDASIADDGSVAFISRARNMTLPEEASGTPQASADDVYVVRPDMSAVKASVDNAGVGGDDDSYEPAISANGRFVAFSSLANNLVAGASGNADRDIFVRDLVANTTRLVSAGMGGVVPNGASITPAINADGSYVSFVSGAENIAPGDNNAMQDVFLASLANGGISKISVRPGIENHQANDASYMPALSASGLIVAFKSKASNLIDGDDNLAFDTFIRDLQGVPPTPCTENCGPVGPGGPITGLGYRFVAGDGGIFNFDMHNFGSMGAERLNRPIVGMASTPSGNGYWMVATDGGIFSFGDAAFHGSTGDIRLNSPIVGMAAHPSGKGYWFVAADGGIFAFGDAGFHGSMGGKPLNKPIVAMAASESGKGYWLVASDGGIFAFGDAAFHGSTGHIKLNKPIVGMDRSSSGDGYRFVASDGGIFAFGDASFLGSMGGTPLNKPIVGMAKSRVGDGYWLVASDGGIFSFGDAGFKGSTGDIRLNSPIVGMAS